MNRKTMKNQAHRLCRRLDGFLYSLTAWLFYPLNLLLAAIFLRRPGDGVLFVSVVTHQPYLITRHLRAQGFRADFLAKGDGWLFFDECAWDYRMKRTWMPGPLKFMYEWAWAWRLYPRYRIVHSDFLQLIGSGFWELAFLRRMGKKLVFHFSGDDLRRKEVNEQLNPDLNCCQECDYADSYCHDPRKDVRLNLAKRYGDLFLVTTPDLRDFLPEAVHFPFTLPELPGQLPTRLQGDRGRGEKIRILHVTNHEGIDGTRHVVDAVRRLREEGYAIDLMMPKKIPFQGVLRMYREADLTIGKLTMGYYANAQIESMYFGLPTLCYIRDVFLKQVPDCPIINVRPDNLYEKLRYYLTHRDELAAIGRRGPDFVRKYHSGSVIARRLIDMYQRIHRPDSTAVRSEQ